MSEIRKFKVIKIYEEADIFGSKMGILLDGKLTQVNWNVNDFDEIKKLHDIDLKKEITQIVIEELNNYYKLSGDEVIQYTKELERVLKTIREYN